MLSDTVADSPRTGMSEVKLRNISEQRITRRCMGQTHLNHPRSILIHGDATAVNMETGLLKCHETRPNRYGLAPYKCDIT